MAKVTQAVHSIAGVLLEHAAGFLLLCLHFVRLCFCSPLENHHLAAAFKLMRHPDFNFPAALPKCEFERFRKVVIELVLATDMKQHFSILSHFTTVHRCAQFSQGMHVELQCLLGWCWRQM
jgi:hypothetical protein